MVETIKRYRGKYIYKTDVEGMHGAPQIQRQPTPEESKKISESDTTLDERRISSATETASNTYPPTSILNIEDVLQPAVLALFDDTPDLVTVPTSGYFHDINKPPPPPSPTFHPQKRTRRTTIGSRISKRSRR